MPRSNKTLRPSKKQSAGGTSSAFSPNAALGESLQVWIDASATGSLYTLDAGALNQSPQAPVLDPLVWFDAGDSGTVRDGIGDAVQLNGNVSAWSSKNGNTLLNIAGSGSVFLQSDSGQRCVVTDGTSYLVNDSGDGGLDTSACTIFCVYRNDEWQTGISPFDAPRNLYDSDFLDATTQGIRFENGSNQFNAYIGTTTAGTIANGGVTTKGQHGKAIHSLRYNYTVGSVRIRHNGVSVDTAIGATFRPASFFTSLSLFAGFSTDSVRRFKGAIFEYMVFDGDLSDGQVAQVENYLANKYGISIVTRSLSETATGPTNPLTNGGYAPNLWLDGADNSSSSMTFASGSFSQLQTWRDKSGSGNDFTVTSATYPGVLQPFQNALNKNLVVALNGSQQLRCPKNVIGKSNVTIFAVAARSSGPYGGIISGNTPSDTTPGLLIENSTVGIRGVANVSTLAGGFTGPSVLCGVVDLGAATLFVNGTQSSTTASSGAFSPGTTTSIGTYRQDLANFFAGYICEIICYPCVLPAEERARIERYLSAKWNVGSIPASTLTIGGVKNLATSANAAKRSALQATATDRPTYSTVASTGKPGLRTNDSSDYLVSEAVVQDYIPNAQTSPDTCFVFAATPNASDGQITFGQSGPSTSTNRVYFCSNFNAGMAIFDIGSASTGRLTAVLPTTSAATRIYTVYRQGSSMAIRRDGRVMASTSSASGAWVAPLINFNLTIGREFTSASSSSCTFHEFMAIKGKPSDAVISQLEAYLANKWSASITPTVPNAEAQDWIHRVYDNGGTVSTRTALAVNAFCEAIALANIRDRFYRLNLFCGGAGSSIQSSGVVVPLYQNYRASRGVNQIQGESFGGWTTSSATITANAAPAPAAAPAGAPLASSFKETVSASAPHTMSFPYTATGSACVVSAYIKPDGRDWVMFAVEDAGGNPFGLAWFNLATLSLGSSYYGVSNAAITDAGNGWARISFQCTPTAGSRFLRAYSSTGNNGNTTVGDATKGYFVWGIQLEYGTALTAFDSRPLGNATDTSNAFALTDYAETGASGGLWYGGVGTNSSKRLDTGIPGNTFATSDRHLSAYEMVNATTDYSPSLKQFTSPSTHWSLGVWTVFNDYNYAGYAGVGGQPIAPRQPGHFFGQNTLSTAAQIYRNGLPIASFNSGTAAGSVDSTTVQVFGHASGEHTEARLGGYSIGLKMTDPQILAYYNAVQAFQLALDRNV